MRVSTRQCASILALAVVAVAPCTAHAAAAQQGGGYLGVQVRDLDSASAAQLHLPAVRGARVMSVADSSPAQAAGLRKDDVITEIAGQPVESVAALSRLVREIPAGRKVSLTFYRDGSPHTVSVRTSSPPGSSAYGAPGTELRIYTRPPPGGGAPARFRSTLDSMRRKLDSLRHLSADSLRMRVDSLGRLEGPLWMKRFGRPGGPRFFRFGFEEPGRLGVSLRSLTRQLGAYFGVQDGHGALVAEVRKGSPADSAGLRAGDVIVSVAGKDVRGPGDVARAVRQAPGGPLRLTVIREGARETLQPDLPARGERGGT